MASDEARAHTSDRDRFTRVSAAYAAFRPTYPKELFDFIHGIAPAAKLAWDCGAGTGQATNSLSRHFEQVVATDLSARQVAHASKEPRIDWIVATAEGVPLRSSAADVVTVAQALHWFDHDRFYDEVRRVVVRGGAIVAWTYTSPSMSGDAGRLVRRFMFDDVGPYWPPERRHVDAGYATIPFPFEPIPTPPLHLEYEWTREQLAGYLRTMSATDRYIEANGVDPVLAVERELVEVWPDPEPRRIAWPLVVLAGRVG
jgi:SAM-dependent methyltransferase